MKVQYIKTHTDEHGKTFECGWTAEHTDGEGQRRIDLGVCKQVAPDTFSRKNVTMAPPMECVPTDAPTMESSAAPTRFKDIAIDTQNALRTKTKK